MPVEPVHAAQLIALITRDPVRLGLLRHLQALDLPDAWIAAGVIRDAVWQDLHSRAPSAPEGDIDVIWFDPARCDPALDRALEVRLAEAAPGWDWSVKNQARMHQRNHDAPYHDAGHAMMHWCETTAAVAMRFTAADRLEINAPFGLGDIYDMILRPTPRFRGEKRPIFEARCIEKRWQARFPMLRKID